MLSNSNKKGLLKSVKLPKLSIQQQFDNQEVADRMNRKITFSRNPRHLTQTMTYANALTKSTGQTKFTAEPSQIFFVDYDQHHIYESQLRLVNHSQHTQRIKITPLKHKQFAIATVKYPKQECGDIAPGMAVVISIRFRPPSLNDFYDELIVLVGDGALKIPIIAERQKSHISWPKVVDCEHCWMGDIIKKQVLLTNYGGQAIFHLVDQKAGYFKLEPSVLAFSRQGKQKLTIIFAPEQQGTFTETFHFRSEGGNDDDVTVQIKGGAYSAQIALQQLAHQKVIAHQKNNTLFISATQVGVLATSQLKIKNLAVVQVDYFWYWSHPNLHISNSKGKIKPSELLQFTVSLEPSCTTPERHKLELFLFNLPEKSLIGNVISRNIEGVEAIECLSMDVVTIPVSSALEIAPRHLQIVQPIYWECPVMESINIINSSPVNRYFSVVRVHQQQGVECISKTYDGVVKAQTSQSIQFVFDLKELTPIKKNAWFAISFDNCQTQLISISGCSTYPDLFMETDSLYYGLCKTFSTQKKLLTICNIQNSPVQFKVHNKHRFYDFDFYQFYQFQDESCFKSRFNIYHPTAKQELTEWCKIEANSQMQLQCYLTCREEESIELSIDLQIKNGSTKVLTIIGESHDVHMEMSKTHLNMREIYKGNVYNSNKFLSRELRILNQGHHECAFEIDTSQFQECDIKIEPRKGIIKQHSYQRIDLILEPVKTGEFDISINWKFYDDFKVHSQAYPQLKQLVTFNKMDGNKSMMKERQLQISGVIRGMAMNYYLKDETKAKRVRQKIQDFSQSIKLSSSSFTGSMSSSTKNVFENEKIIYPFLQELNFYNCEINQVKQVEIIIENDSGLTTEYNIMAQKYYTNHNQSSNNLQKKKGLVSVQEEPFTSEMGKTFIKNRMLDRSQKVHLGNNKGISFLCEPEAGTLYKKQSQRVLITMFNDTSGRFQDNLLINIKNHETKKIPMDIFIRGTPINLSRNQLGINFNQQIPLMHFGTVLPNNGTLKKTIKVVNNGPKTATLEWKIYPYNQNNSQEDLFTIEFGQAFPSSSDQVELKWKAIQPQLDNSQVFYLQPRSQIVKGRQSAIFTVLIRQVADIGTFSNLLICEPKLETGSLMQSLALVVQVDSVLPNLTLDIQHKNQINQLQKFALAHEEYQTNSNNNFRKLKLKNLLNANLTFNIDINNKDSQFQSFVIVGTNSNSATQLSHTHSIQKTFSLVCDSIVEVLVELKGNPSNLKEWPIEQKTRKQGQLVINYSNGNQQFVELVGWLYRPWLQIQMPNKLLHSSENNLIDFGTVHVKNSKKISVYLINSSKVDCKWTASYIKYRQSIKYKFQQTLWTNEDYEDEQITDEKKCWRLNAQGGTVKSMSLPVHYMPMTSALPNKDDHYAQTHQPTQLTFMFKPDSNLIYKSKFRIAVMEGLTFDIVVRGRGSYEEELQLK